MSLLPEKLHLGESRAYPIEMMLRQPITRTMDAERSLLHFVLPPWQRPEVWDQARKRTFIEGIFLGLGTGIYVHHEVELDHNGQMKPMSGWLIDGQQRISAIRDFVHNKLEIFDGLQFSDISPAEQRRRFLHVVFPSHEIPYQQDERMHKELYHRLNFGGVAHTTEDLQRLETALPVSTEGSVHPVQRQR
jgi:hypothetical protein